MSFQPVIPFGGYTGWKFLSRTLAPQQTAFNKTPVIQRDTDYFKANIGKIKTAEALVDDRRLLKVALGAFGLDSDIDSTFFIRKVLQDGTLTTGALANKLADKRYLEFSKAFGFGDYATPSTQLSDFGTQITDLYQTRQFEIAVGDSDTNLRLALGLQRDLGAVAAKSSGEDTKWYTILGNTALRTVFQTALGLPASFAAIDVDKQLATLKSRVAATFGDDTVSQFKDPAQIGALVKKFLLRADAQGVSAQSLKGSAALLMLQSSQTQYRTLLSR